MALSPKRQRFIVEYPVDLNATKAAERSGFSPKTAYSQGQRLLKNVEIQQAIAKTLAKRTAAAEISVEWVLNGLKTVAERCMQEVEVLTRDGNRTGEFTFNPAGANRAYELIGKHLRMFTEKVELTGRDGAPIEVTDPFDMSEEELAVIAAQGIVTKGNGRRRNGGGE